MFAFVWIFLSFCFYFYIFTHYLFLPLSGQSILLSIIFWSVLVGGITLVKHRFPRSQKSKWLFRFLLSYLMLIIIHMILSLLILCYAKETLFDYDWVNIAIGMLGIPIGICLYQLLTKYRSF